MNKIPGPVTRMTIRRILLTGLLLGSAGRAFSQEIVVTLLPRTAGVWQFNSQGAASTAPGNPLKVTDADARDSRGKPLMKAISWLDFPATELPAGITISKAQLVVARVYGGELVARPMVIDVVPVDTNDGKKFPAPDTGVVGTIQSDPDTRTSNMYLAGAASLKAAELASKLTGTPTHLILLLEPTASASQREFYGLDSDDPGLQPRLIITYRYNTQPPASPYTSEPSAFAACSV